MPSTSSDARPYHRTGSRETHRTPRCRFDGENHSRVGFYRGGRSVVTEKTPARLSGFRRALFEPSVEFVKAPTQRRVGKRFGHQERPPSGQRSFSAKGRAEPKSRSLIAHGFERNLDPTARDRKGPAVEGVAEVAVSISHAVLPLGHFHLADQLSIARQPADDATSTPHPFALIRGHRAGSNAAQPLGPPVGLHKPPPDPLGRTRDHHLGPDPVLRGEKPPGRKSDRRRGQHQPDDPQHGPRTTGTMAPRRRGPTQVPKARLHRPTHSPHAVIRPTRRPPTRQTAPQGRPPPSRS